MEEDLELLRSMYIEGREIEIQEHPFQTRITFQLTPFLQNPTSPLTIVICEACVTSVKIGSLDINIGSLLLPCEIVEWVLENHEELIVAPIAIVESNETTDGSYHAVVYSLDHIRNSKGYFKALTRFARESLCKCGVLVAREGTSGGIRMVVVGPSGDKEAPKDFLMRHRTVNVDVDSKGLLNHCIAINRVLGLFICAEARNILHILYCDFHQCSLCNRSNNVSFSV